MSRERTFPSSKVSDTYRDLRNARSAEPTPRSDILRYNLSQMRDWERWEDHMRSTGFFASKNIEGMMVESLAEDAPREKRIFTDKNRSYLIDEHKIEKSDEPIEQYIEDNDRWENTTVVYRDWAVTPFTRIANAERHRRVTRSRHIYIFSDETQEQIQESLVADGGAGAGGITTVLWAMSGGEHYRVADPTPLGPHKILRFSNGNISDLEVNQAVLITRQIYDLNPHAEVDCYPGGLSVDGAGETISLKDFYRDATFGIEAMDNLPLKLQAREVMMQLGVPVVMPTDLNREGFVGLNDNVLGRMNGKVMRQLANPEIDQEEKTEIVIANFLPPDVPEHMVEPLHRGKNLPYWPQSGLAAFASAAGAVYTMIRYLEGAKDIPKERPIRLSW